MIVEQILTKEENPEKAGWYDTDKGNLFWYALESTWSCRDDRCSAEYPTKWYRPVKWGRVHVKRKRNTTELIDFVKRHDSFFKEIIASSGGLEWDVNRWRTLITSARVQLGYSATTAGCDIAQKLKQVYYQKK